MQNFISYCLHCNICKDKFTCQEALEKNFYCLLCNNKESIETKHNCNELTVRNCT